MPLYEFECEACHHRFEELVRRGEAARCPSCAGERLRRLLSAHTVGGGSAVAEAAPGPCGRCGDPRGPGACALD